MVGWGSTGLYHRDGLLGWGLYWAVARRWTYPVRLMYSVSAHNLAWVRPNIIGPVLDVPCGIRATQHTGVFCSTEKAELSQPEGSLM